jgi:hypothetical protein
MHAASFVVDAARRVVESDAAALHVGVGAGVGEALEALPSWLAEPAREAIDAAATAGEAERVARDHARGAHWILHATVARGEPWRARVVAMDVTPAVVRDREATFASLAHALGNVAFGMRSVLDAIDVDHPEGAELVEYLAHLRDPIDRLAVTTTRLAMALETPRAGSERVAVDAIVERALASVAPSCRPARVDAVAERMFVRGDAVLLAEPIAAMLESAAEGTRPALAIARDERRGRPYARVSVERRYASVEPEAVGGPWDLAGSLRLDTLLHLAHGRAVIAAHEGEVTAERVEGGVRLAVLLPLIREC